MYAGSNTDKDVNRKAKKKPALVAGNRRKLVQTDTNDSGVTFALISLVS